MACLEFGKNPWTNVDRSTAVGCDCASRNRKGTRLSAVSCHGYTVMDLLVPPDDQSNLDLGSVLVAGPGWPCSCWMVPVVAALPAVVAEEPLFCDEHPCAKRSIRDRECQACQSCLMVCDGVRCQ
jgi:hypothetical protein